MAFACETILLTTAAAQPTAAASASQGARSQFHAAAGDGEGSTQIVGRPDPLRLRAEPQFRPRPDSAAAAGRQAGEREHPRREPLDLRSQAPLAASAPSDARRQFPVHAADVLGDVGEGRGRGWASPDIPPAPVGAASARPRAARARSGSADGRNRPPAAPRPSPARCRRTRLCSPGARTSGGEPARRSQRLVVGSDLGVFAQHAVDGVKHLAHPRLGHRALDHHHQLRLVGRRAHQPPRAVFRPSRARR